MRRGDEATLLGGQHGSGSSKGDRRHSAGEEEDTGARREAGTDSSLPNPVCDQLCQSHRA